MRKEAAVRDGWDRESLKPVDENDPKGKCTWEWKFPDGKQITVYRRQKGFITNHVHSGKDPSKNPERLLLTYGKAKITFFRPRRGRINTLQEINCDARKNPQVITIQPGTSHRFEALTDVEYIEYRITHFDPKNPDTSPAELP